MTVNRELFAALEMALFIAKDPDSFSSLEERETAIYKWKDQAKKAIENANKEAAKIPPPPTIDLATVFIGGMHSSEILEMQRWWNKGNPIPFDMYTQTAFKAGWNAAMREVINIATPSPSVED